MKVRILNHRELSKGVKEVTVANIYDKKESVLTLTDKSYTNFVKYVMYLWSGNQTTRDIVTKVVKNNDCYCFYRV